nr:MAG TPA: hypothetical protein [Caudoviricetes sp.]
MPLPSFWLWAPVRKPPRPLTKPSRQKNRHN